MTFDRIAKMKAMKNRKDKADRLASIKAAREDEKSEQSRVKPRNVAEAKTCIRCGTMFAPSINVQENCPNCFAIAARESREGRMKRCKYKPIQPRHYRPWLELFKMLEKEIGYDRKFKINEAALAFDCNRKLAYERICRMRSHRMVDEINWCWFRLRPEKDWLYEV